MYLTDEQRADRTTRLQHCLDEARRQAERKRVAARRALEPLAEPVSDDEGHRVRLVREAADLEIVALAAERVVVALTEELRKL